MKTGVSGWSGGCVLEDTDGVVDVFFGSSGCVVADTTRGVCPAIQNGEFRGFALGLLVVFVLPFFFGVGDIVVAVVAAVCCDVFLGGGHVVFFLFGEVCVHWGVSSC